MGIKDTMIDAACEDVLIDISDAIIQEFERWDKRGSEKEQWPDWNEIVRGWIAQNRAVNPGRLPNGFEQAIANVIEPVIRDLIK